MRILAVLNSPAGSGPDTTMRRIAGHLSATGHTVVLAAGNGRPGFLATLARTHRADVLIGSHALVGGGALVETGLPYVLVFEGTDLNQFVHDRQSLEIMTKAVDGAAALVAFNDDFAARCTALWPHVRDRLHVISQGVQATENATYSMRDSLGLPGEAHVFLLPAGLRPVKDPLMLVNEVQRWHRDDPRVHLVIAGPCHDDDFEAVVRRALTANPGVRYAGNLARPDLLAAMVQSVAVLNTSISECSPNALLEAMWLRRPVLARNIAGNTCLVRDGSTGLVFTDPAGFRRQATRLLNEPGLAARLGARAGEFARTAHGLPEEREAYGRLFVGLAGVVPPPLPARAPAFRVPSATLTGAPGAGAESRRRTA